MRPILILLFAISMVACGPNKRSGSLCERTFSPYPDLVTGRARTSANAGYLDAMALYAKGEFLGARDGLKTYLAKKGADKAAYMYLACCHLALGEPYDAELQLDHLQRSSVLQFDDQIEWYSAVSLLCSGQLDRARAAAAVIANSGPHTYSGEATVLLKELGALTKE